MYFMKFLDISNVKNNRKNYLNNSGCSKKGPWSNILKFFAESVYFWGTFDTIYKKIKLIYYIFQ